MKELIEQRTLTSKVFDITDEPEEGTHRLVTRLNPIHYDNNGLLEDIDTTVINKGVHACNYDIDLYTDKIGYYGTDPDGKRIELELEEQYVEPIITGNTVLYQNVSNGSDLQLIFLPGQIQVNRFVFHKTAKRTGTFRIVREAGIRGKLLNLGSDSNGKRTRLVVSETPTGNIDELRVTQTWTGEVAVRDKKTRKKNWSKEDSDIKYPVIIDPTSTFTLAANLDDGEMRYSASTGILGDQTKYNGAISFPTAPASARFARGAYQRFTGITIPQSSTINAATLKVYAGSTNGTRTCAVHLKSANNAAVPGSNKAGANYILNRENVVAGSAVFSAATLGAYTTTKNNYALHNVDVQTMTQNLVNAFDFSSGIMMFSLTRQSDYMVAVYAKNWGATKDPELVIDYSAPVPVSLVEKTIYNFI